MFHRLPYSEFFGGVSGLTVEQFRKINGFPNAFWGWGGEDDDLWNRSVGTPFVSFPCKTSVRPTLSYYDPALYIGLGDLA